MSKILVINEKGFIMACPDNEQLQTYENYEKFDLVNFSLPMQLSVRVPTVNFKGVTAKPFASSNPFKLTGAVDEHAKYKDVWMYIEDILASYVFDLNLQNDPVIEPLLSGYTKALHVIKKQAQGAFLFPKNTNIKYNPLDKNNPAYDKYFVNGSAFNQETNDTIKIYSRAYFEHLEKGEMLVHELAGKIPKSFKYYTMTHLNPGSKVRAQITIEWLARNMFLKTRYDNKIKVIKLWDDKFKINPNYLLSLKGQNLKNESVESIEKILNVARWKDLGDVYLSVQISKANEHVGFIKKIDDIKVANNARQTIVKITDNPKEVSSIHFDLLTALKVSKTISINSKNSCVVAHYTDWVLMQLFTNNPDIEKIKQVQSMNVIIEKIKIEQSLGVNRDNKANNLNIDKGSKLNENKSGNAKKSLLKI